MLGFWFKLTVKQSSLSYVLQGCQIGETLFQNKTRKGIRNKTEEHDKVWKIFSSQISQMSKKSISTSWNFSVTRDYVRWKNLWIFLKYANQDDKSTCYRLKLSYQGTKHDQSEENTKERKKERDKEIMRQRERREIEWDRERER